MFVHVKPQGCDFSAIGNRGACYNTGSFIHKRIRKLDIWISFGFVELMIFLRGFTYLLLEGVSSVSGHLSQTYYNSKIIGVYCHYFAQSLAKLNEVNLVKKYICIYQAKNTPGLRTRPSTDGSEGKGSNVKTAKQLKQKEDKKEQTGIWRYGSEMSWNKNQE